MAVPVLNAVQDYGGTLSPLDRRQFIEYGGKYRGSFVMGVAKPAHKRAVKFTTDPVSAQAIYDLIADASLSPGYFKWQAWGDKQARYWSVDPDSLELVGESYGRAVVSVKLTEWPTVGGVV